MNISLIPDILSLLPVVRSLNIKAFYSENEQFLFISEPINCEVCPVLFHTTLAGLWHLLILLKK